MGKLSRRGTHPSPNRFAPDWPYRSRRPRHTKTVSPFQPPGRIDVIAVEWGFVENRSALYACLIVQATNLGLVGMAEASGIA